MINPEVRGWKWEDASPLAQAVIATCTGRVGDSAGELTSMDYTSAMTGSLEGVTDDDVRMGFVHGGFVGLLNTVVGKLSGVNADVIREMTSELGRLAGGDDPINYLASHVSQELRRPRAYDAIPGLRALSELAVLNQMLRPKK